MLHGSPSPSPSVSQCQHSVATVTVVQYYNHPLHSWSVCCHRRVLNCTGARAGTLQVTRMNVLGVLSADSGGYELVVRVMDDVGTVEDYHDDVCCAPVLRLRAWSTWASAGSCMA